MSTHEYVVVIPKEVDDYKRKLIIDDVSYKGYNLVEIVDCADRPSVQLARFRRVTLDAEP